MERDGGEMNNFTIEYTILEQPLDLGMQYF
jgi:hypothetical protein